MYIKNMWNALMSIINDKQFHEKFNELTCEAVHKSHSISQTTSLTHESLHVINIQYTIPLGTC